MTCIPTSWPLVDLCNGFPCNKSSGGNGCLCPKDFAKTGDFIPIEIGCHADLRWLKYVWLPVAISWGMVGLYIANRVRAHGLTMQLRNLATCLSFLVSSICMVVLGILKYLDPVLSIGTDLSVSLMFAVGTTMFWYAAINFGYTFVQYHAKAVEIASADKPNIVKYVDLIQRSHLPMVSINVFWTLVPPLLMMVWKEQYLLFIGMHLLGLSLTLIYFAFFSLFPFIDEMVKDLNRMIEQLQDSPDSSTQTSYHAGDANTRPEASNSVRRRLEKLKGELRFVRREATKQATTNLITIILFTFIPFFRERFSYMLVVNWTFASLIGFAMCRTLKGGDRNAKPKVRPINGVGNSTSILTHANTFKLYKNKTQTKTDTSIS